MTKPGIRLPNEITIQALAQAPVGILLKARSAILVATLLVTGGCASVPADLGRGEVDDLVAARGQQIDEASADLLESLINEPLTQQSVVRIVLLNNPELQATYATLGFGAADIYETGRIRILVTNSLKEHTTVHWHGLLLPSGMDGVGGLNQPHIQSGETFAYEFTLRQHGSHMYHPHADEMTQLAVGMMGMFIIHPEKGEPVPIDRDYCFVLHNWALHPGTYRPDPAIMVDFDLWTI